MNKTACLMTLEKTPSPETARAGEYLRECVSKYFDLTGAQAYPTVKALVVELAEKLSANSAVIIAAEPALFYSAKDVLIRALSLAQRDSSEIIVSLPIGYVPKSAQEYKRVVAFPENAGIFPSANGLLTGFEIASGEQHIVFLPLEANLIDYMLSRQLRGFFESIGTRQAAPEPQSAAAPKEQGQTAPAAAQTASAQPQMPTEPAEGAPAIDRLAEKAVALMLEKGLTAAVASTGPKDSLRQVFAAVANSDKAVRFDEAQAEKWSGGEFNDYFSGVVKAAKERCGTDYAMALSGLYSDKESGKKFIFYALADKTGAKIVKVTGEQTASIVYDCAVEMLESLVAAADGRGKPADVEKKVKAAPKAGGPIVKSRTPLIIAAVMLAAAVLACFAITFFVTPAPAEETTVPVTELTTEPVTQDIYVDGLTPQDDLPLDGSLPFDEQTEQEALPSEPDYMGGEQPEGEY